LTRQIQSFSQEIYIMETTLIRGFVLFLALTGFGASSVSSNSTHSSNVHAQGLNGGGAPPVCPPSDPNSCGID
jgi:hypothetical protein